MLLFFFYHVYLVVVAPCAGIWRQLTVRYSKRTHDLTLLLCVSLRSLQSLELWVDELTRLGDFLHSLRTPLHLDNESEDLSARMAFNIKSGVEDLRLEFDTESPARLVSGFSVQV